MNVPDAYSDLLTDAMFTCPTRRAARAAASHQMAPVYRYYYTHTRTFGVMSAFRAYHSAELDFVFGHVGTGIDIASSAEQALSGHVMDFWGTFAQAGAPSSAAAPAWPIYQPAVDNYLVLDTSIETAQGLTSGNCDYWDTVTSN